MTRPTHPSFVDMTGALFRPWAVLKRLPNSDRGARWQCRCVKCGVLRAFLGTELRAAAPRCTACGAKSESELVREAKEKRKPEPVIVFDEPRVIAGRCMRCQSRSGFEVWRGAERCNNCGSSSTRDGAQHVAGGCAL